MNPYLAFAATIAAGLHGIEHGIDPGDAVRRQRVRGRRRRAGAAESIVDAIAELERSEIAGRLRSAPTCTTTSLNTARQEWLSFDRAVTDWERRRYFEQF